MLIPFIFENISLPLRIPFPLVSHFHNVIFRLLISPYLPISIAIPLLLYCQFNISFLLYFYLLCQFSYVVFFLSSSFNSFIFRLYLFLLPFLLFFVFFLLSFFYSFLSRFLVLRTCFAHLLLLLWTCCTRFSLLTFLYTPGSFHLCMLITRVSFPMQLYYTPVSLYSAPVIDTHFPMLWSFSIRQFPHLTNLLCLFNLFVTLFPLL